MLQRSAAVLHIKLPNLDAYTLLHYNQSIVHYKFNEKNISHEMDGQSGGGPGNLRKVGLTADEVPDPVVQRCRSRRKIGKPAPQKETSKQGRSNGTENTQEIPPETDILKVSRRS